MQNIEDMKEMLLKQTEKVLKNSVERFLISASCECS